VSRAAAAPPTSPLARSTLFRGGAVLPLSLALQGATRFHPFTPQQLIPNPAPE
jgi:hypothetical protein